MNVWTRGGISLIKLPELAQAAALSGQRIERCAYVLRRALDSALSRNADGFFLIDAHDVAFTLSCAPSAIERALESFLYLGLTDDVAASVGIEAGHIAHWRDWAVERAALAHLD